MSETSATTNSNMEHPEVFTEEQYQKLLEIYTGKKYLLKSFDLNPLSELNGLIAKTYKLKLNYDENGEEKSAQLFIKSIENANPVMYKIAKELETFEKESFFYGKLVPLMENAGFDCSFAPKGYFYANGSVVMEDLSINSFKELPKNKPLDLEQCKKCLETIARFHATPILYETNKSRELGNTYRLNEEFGEFLWDIIEDSNKDSSIIKYISNSVYGLCELVDIIPLNGYDAEKLKSKLIATLDIKFSKQPKNASLRSTILHNDLWATNFLCQLDDLGKIKACKLIDYQTISYGPPAFDIIGFIYTNTRKSFRENHLDELLKYYYDYLSSLFEEQGFVANNILTEDEFRICYETMKLTKKLFAIVDRSITFTPDEEYLEASQSEESFAKFLLEERGKHMVKCFKENEQFKELIIEEIHDIASMLF